MVGDLALLDSITQSPEFINISLSSDYNHSEIKSKHVFNKTFLLKNVDAVITELTSLSYLKSIFKVTVDITSPPASKKASKLIVKLKERRINYDVSHKRIAASAKVSIESLFQSIKVNHQLAQILTSQSVVEKHSHILYLRLSKTFCSIR